MASTHKDEARLSELQAEMTRIHTDAGDNDLSGEMRSRWEALETERRTLTNRIARQRLINAHDRNAPAVPLDGSDRHFDAFRADLTLIDAYRAAAGGTDTRCGRVREASQEIIRRTGRQPREGGLMFSVATPETRTLTSGGQGTAPNGATLIPTIVRADSFIDALRAQMVVRQLGATVLGDLTGNVSVPKRTASSTAYWFAENTAIPVSTPAYGAVALTPKHCGVLTEVSRNMLLQSSADVALLAQQDMAAVLAEALDLAALTGDGTNAQPIGLTHLVPTTTYSGAAPTWANITGAIGTLQAAHVNPTGWALSPGVGPALMATPLTTTSMVMTGPTSPDRKSVV